MPSIPKPINKGITFTRFLKISGPAYDKALEKNE